MPLPAVATANGGTERYTRTPTQQRATLPNARAVQALKPGRKSRLGETPVKRWSSTQNFSYRARATRYRTKATSRERSPIFPTAMTESVRIKLGEAEQGHPEHYHRRDSTHGQGRFRQA